MIPREATETECNRIPCPKWIYGHWSEVFSKSSRVYLFSVLDPAMEVFEFGTLLVRMPLDKTLTTSFAPKPKNKIVKSVTSMSAPSGNSVLGLFVQLRVERASKPGVLNVWTEKVAFWQMIGATTVSVSCKSNAPVQLALVRLFS